MSEKEQQFERIYEKTKDFGRTQFVREIQMQINDNKKKDKKIKELQKKAELGEHYKHLYSELKKQKDDVVEYVKNYDVFKEFSFPLMKKWEENQVKSSIDYQFKESIKKELLRMLGEIDE